MQLSYWNKTSFFKEFLNVFYSVVVLKLANEVSVVSNKQMKTGNN